MMLEGGRDGAAFRPYVEQVLVPQLRPGQVVVRDNLKAHKVAGIREAIEAAQTQLVYLPPYSPDLSPIELCWSKLKMFLRVQAARTRATLEEAWSAARLTITTSDALH